MPRFIRKPGMHPMHVKNLSQPRLSDKYTAPKTMKPQTAESPSYKENQGSLFGVASLYVGYIWLRNRHNRHNEIEVRRTHKNNEEKSQPFLESEDNHLSPESENEETFFENEGGQDDWYDY